MRYARALIPIPCALGLLADWKKNIAKVHKMSTFGHAAAGGRNLVCHNAYWRDPSDAADPVGYRGQDGDAARPRTGH